MPDGIVLVAEADDAALDAVFRRAFAGTPSGPRDDFLQAELAPHRDREGFSLVCAVQGGAVQGGAVQNGAVRDGVLLGFVYGYTGRRGQWWSDRVAAHAPQELVDCWVGGHFEVVELAVVPEARGRGIGAALMTSLLADRHEPCALLATWQAESPARRLYERLGWIELLHDLDGESSLYGRLLR